MELAKRQIMSAALWVAVAIGIAAIALAARHGETIVGHTARALDDPMPGARVKPDPEKMQAAQAAWRRRRAE